MIPLPRRHLTDIASRAPHAEAVTQLAAEHGPGAQVSQRG